MKVRTAIFTVYVAANALGFAVLMRFMLAEVRPRYVNSLRQTLESSARMLAVALEGQSEPATIVGRATQAGLRVRLVGQNEEILADTSAPPEEEEEYGARSARGLAKRTVTGWLDDEGSEGAAEIAASASIELADGSRGAVILSRPIRSVNDVIWSERKKLAGVGFFIAGVMVVAGWWIAARLTHPIERLTRYAQAVRDGRGTTPPRSRATEIAALATAFEEMRETLEGRRHAERYTRALAHEIKAPLTAIRGAAELLGEEMETDARRHFLENIRGESARIHRIVERLLELTSLEARKVLEQPEQIEADALMTEVADEMRAAYVTANVSLAVSGGSGVSVRGERFLLRQALLNLLQNALDFSDTGTAVELSAHEEAGEAIFTVDDRGTGVPEFARERVFERFYSLPRPDTGRKSTGIGLALVREVAHLHGGEATLTNREGGGASAILRLPLLSAG